MPVFNQLYNLVGCAPGWNKRIHSAPNLSHPCPV